MEDGLGTDVDSGRGFAFEHYLAWHLVLALSASVALSEVFEFTVKDHLLAKRSGSLIAAYGPNNSNHTTVEHSEANAGATYTLEYSLTPEFFLVWLGDAQRRCLCFPSKEIGPDIIFLLLLDDGSKLWITVQIKNLSQPTIPPSVVLGCFAGLDPPNFRRRKNGAQKSSAKVRPSCIIVTIAYLRMTGWFSWRHCRLQNH